MLALRRCPAKGTYHYWHCLYYILGFSVYNLSPYLAGSTLKGGALCSPFIPSVWCSLCHMLGTQINAEFKFELTDSLCAFTVWHHTKKPTALNLFLTSQGMLKHCDYSLIHPFIHLMDIYKLVVPDIVPRWNQTDRGPVLSEFTV